MISNEELRVEIYRVQGLTGFSALLLEKDFHITRILSGMNSICDGLVFKGGTCLNKIYFPYFRLSEDLDFTLQISEGEDKLQRVNSLFSEIPNSLIAHVAKYDLKDGGYTRASEYMLSLFLQYNSVITKGISSINIEISAFHNPIQVPQIQNVNNIFREPGGTIKCYTMLETIAEKMRASAERLNIAPRDFRDLAWISQNIKHGLVTRPSQNIINGYDLISLFVQKCSQSKRFDMKSYNINDYLINMGRSHSDIKTLRKIYYDTIRSVVKTSETNKIDLDDDLKQVNNFMAQMVQTYIFANRKKR